MRFPVSFHLHSLRGKPRPSVAGAASLAHLELLERRTLLSASLPNDEEQYLLELINRARANPIIEASTFGIDLNEGLPDETITADPKQPLALNLNLVTAARGHSQWMIDNDIFAHDEPGTIQTGPIDPGDRMAAQGYNFVPPYAWGENIAWKGQTGSIPDPVITTAELHQDLFVDAGIADRGHRTNMLDPVMKEIGTGVVTGDFQGYNAVMATEDFAFTGTASFLTGVAYDDNVLADQFYSPGEGLGGVTITAVRDSDNASFTTTTWSTGGYTLPLASGTYTVTASGGGITTPIIYSNVTLAADNVKRDFVPTAPIDVLPPVASAISAADVSAAGPTSYSFTITYGDDVAVDATTLDNNDIRVTGPGGFSRLATLQSLDAQVNGPSRVATYRFTPPGGDWGPLDNGQYTISLLPGQVADTTGNQAAAAALKSFTVAIPPTVSIAATDASAAELNPPSANTATFTFTRNGSPANLLTVTYSAAGTAQNGVDYDPISGTAIFDPGSATATVTITPINDTSVEGTETVILTLSPSANGMYSISSTQSAATITIADNDRANTWMNTPAIVSGTDPGRGPLVNGYDAATASQRFSFNAYDPGFEGGVRVAVGDVNGDGTPDILTAPGKGGPPNVRVFDGRNGNQLTGPNGSFFAYDPGFLGGVFIAAGDVDGDGKADIITAADAGAGPHVKVFSGADGTLIRSFFAYDSGFQSGVRVAAGDVNGDGFCDIITGAGAAAPHVRVFSGRDGAMLYSFMAYDPGFQGGIYVAAGDVNGDGKVDILTGTGTGPPHVKAFSGGGGGNGTLLASFFAYDPAFGGGVRVGATDVNGDGRADILTGPGFGGGSNLMIFDGATSTTPSGPTPIQSYFGYSIDNLQGIYVAGEVV
ncbi:MAG TPA: FG-GAP-like repeat-containing protein [Tepidisphaeraceae bacterium]